MRADDVRAGRHRLAGARQRARQPSRHIRAQQLPAAVLIGLVDPGSRPFGELVRAIWTGMLNALRRLAPSRRE